MSANGCCKVAARESGQETTEKRIFGSNRPKPTFVQRFLENAGWIVPGAILALLPKCPACVATYAVIGTGVGLSLSATTYQHLPDRVDRVAHPEAVATWRPKLVRCAAAFGALAVQKSSELGHGDLRRLEQHEDRERSADHGVGATPRSAHQPRTC